MGKKMSNFEFLNSNTFNGDGENRAFLGGEMAQPFINQPISAENSNMAKMADIFSG